MTRTGNGETVRIDRADDIATVTIDRPERLNAIDTATWRALGRAMTEVSADGDIRCVVLRGAGERAFGVGADIKEFAEVRGDIASARAYSAIADPAVTALQCCRHPVVAMIHGYCVGGSFELLPACDMRIAGESARFGIPINKLGAVAGYAEIRDLAQLGGLANVLEILLEGRLIDAREAREKGFVNRVVPDADLEAEVYGTARRIADGAPLVARWHKKFARRLLDPAPITEAELDEGYACFETEDYRTGREAFVAKSTPRFKGR